MTFAISCCCVLAITGGADDPVSPIIRSKGRLWANVQLAKGNRAGDTQVIFDVCEGPIVRVRSSTVIGNKALKTEQLLMVLKRPILAIPGAFVSAHTPSDDLAVLMSFYHEHGYPAVKIARELKFDDDLSQVDVTYRIEEGR